VGCTPGGLCDLYGFVDEPVAGYGDRPSSSCSRSRSSAVIGARGRLFDRGGGTMLPYWYSSMWPVETVLGDPGAVVRCMDGAEEYWVLRRDVRDGWFTGRGSGGGRA
jgi:hypothetical protein